MTELVIKAILSGLCFGLWPLLLYKSGLGGSTLSAVYCSVVLAVVLAFSLHEVNITKLQEARWAFIILGCLTGATGILLFNGGLVKTTTESVAVFIVMTTLAQIAVPAIYEVVKNGVTPTRMAGFALAGLATYLLSK